MIQWIGMGLQAEIISAENVFSDFPIAISVPVWYNKGHKGEDGLLP